MVKLVDVCLSDNPEAKVIPSTEGIGGNINVASNGAKYIVLKIKDIENPFNHRPHTRTYIQREVEKGIFKWPGATPQEWLKLKGKDIPGRFVTAKVEEYEFEDRKTGELRSTTQFTTYVQPGVTVEAAFEAAGHKLVSKVEETVDAEAVEA